MSKQLATRLQALIVFTFCAALPLLAQGSIPDNVNYQGYLTDVAGTPVDADLTVTFNLYNVEAGGVPLWSDTRVVPVMSGLFSV